MEKNQTPCERKMPQQQTVFTLHTRKQAPTSIDSTIPDIVEPYANNFKTASLNLKDMSHALNPPPPAFFCHCVYVYLLESPCYLYICFDLFLFFVKSNH